MAKRPSSIVKTNSAISMVDPTELIKAITETINTVSNTVDKYFDYKVAKGENDRLKLSLKTDLKNAKIKLDAFDKTLKFNMKFIKTQSKDTTNYRENLIMQSDYYKSIYSTLTKTYSELALKDNVKKEILDSIGDKLTEINNSHIEIIKQMRPASFTTINM